MFAKYAYSWTRWTSSLYLVWQALDAEIQGLIPGKLYEFRVAGVNSTGAGPWLSTAMPVEAKMPYGKIVD